MPITYTILPKRNLILFTYSGAIGLQEASDAVAACAADPGYCPAMRQLCDLTGVTSVEKDFPKLMQVQAEVADSLRPGGSDLIVLFYATSGPGHELAQMARRSWEGLNSVIVMIHDREDEAMAMLGLPETRISDLTAAAEKV